MITTYYYYLLVALIVTTSVFGLLFLTQFNENKVALKSFRIAKRTMAIAFFCVAIGNILELIGHTEATVNSSDDDFILTQILTLSVSTVQAFVHTLVCILLLDPKSIKLITVKHQMVAVILYVLATIASYIFLPKSVIKFSIHILNAVYCGVLVYFTVFFARRYHAFRKVMDNFYSDSTVARMCWIVIAFYCSLGIGILSLITTQYSSLVLNFIFGISLLCFYTFFGIKLLNYPWQFRVIEKPIIIEKSTTDTPIAETFEDIQSSLALDIKTNSISYESTPRINSKASIGEWIEEKHFLKSGITIDDLAGYLGTNSTYISSYFNTYKGITFRQWVNYLRIEEAKRIITNTPKTTMTELATRLGYNDTRTFYRQFKAIEGVQPSIWKANN